MSEKPPLFYSQGDCVMRRSIETDVRPNVRHISLGGVLAEAVSPSMASAIARRLNERDILLAFLRRVSESELVVTEQAAKELLAKLMLVSEGGGSHG